MFFELDVTFVEFLYNICVIIINIGTKYSVILLSPSSF